jgi:hypothetical protein
MIGTHLDQHKRIEAEVDEDRPRGHQYRDRPLPPLPSNGHGNGNGQSKTDAPVHLTVQQVLAAQLTPELEEVLRNLNVLKDEIDLELDDYLDTFIIYIHRENLAKAVEMIRIRTKPVGGWDFAFQYLKRQAQDYWVKFGRPESSKTGLRD